MRKNSIKSRVKNVKKPELLLPAGNLEKLKVGLVYGGDAFYLGFSPFSLRCNDSGFTKETLLEGVSLLKKNKKPFYITMNIYPRGAKIDSLKKHIQFVRKEIKPDGIIVADPGFLEMIKEYYPEANLHMSVQANVMNYRSVQFWKKQGASRIILPRELMLSEIKEIHEKVPDIELECFVHGAICVAYSGRCLLSNYMTSRDANQGACAHSCRWKYNVYLEEVERKGEFMPISEDEHGTYIMNSKDNCLLPYLKDLVEAGVCSFKVEGRNKTEYYLATVAAAYRKAIDDMVAGKKFDESLLDEVAKTANRGFIPGYLPGFPAKGDISLESSSPKQTHKFVGVVIGRGHGGLKRDDLYEVDIRNRLDVGDEVEVMTPTTRSKDGHSIMCKVDEMFDLEGESVSKVHGGGGNRILKLVKGLPAFSMIRKTCR